MTTPKFKPGDEIVVVKAWDGETYGNGDRGIIRVRDGSRRDMGWWNVTMGLCNRIIDEEEMEHAAIVDSPLYKALL